MASEASDEELLLLHAEVGPHHLLFDLVWLQRIRSTGQLSRELPVVDLRDVLVGPTPTPGHQIRLLSGPASPLQVVVDRVHAMWRVDLSELFPLPHPLPNLPVLSSFAGVVIRDDVAAFLVDPRALADLVVEGALPGAP